MRLLALFTICFLGFLPVALAQEEDAGSSSVTACGTPKDVTVKPETETYCDIYARRMAYNEKRKALRESIEARRENFGAGQNAALSSYNESVKAYYKEMTPEEEAVFEEGSSDGGFDTETAGESGPAVTQGNDTAILE